MTEAGRTRFDLALSSACLPPLWVRMFYEKVKRKSYEWCGLRQTFCWMTLAVISPRADRVVVAFVAFAFVGKRGIRLAPVGAFVAVGFSLSAFSS